MRRGDLRPCRRVYIQIQKVQILVWIGIRSRADTLAVYAAAKPVVIAYGVNGHLLRWMPLPWLSRGVQRTVAVDVVRSRPIARERVGYGVIQINVIRIDRSGRCRIA